MSSFMSSFMSFHTQKDVGIFRNLFAFSASKDVGLLKDIVIISALYIYLKCLAFMKASWAN